MTKDADGVYEHRYSTNFVIDKNGIRFQHTVRSSTDASDHASNVNQFLDELKSAGLMEDLKVEIPAGHDAHLVEGYVLSMTSKGSHVLYLYAPGLMRILRGGKLYEEKFYAINVNPLDGAKLWNGDAPTKDIAEKQGFYNRLAKPFYIVTGPGFRKKEDGSKIWEVKRVVDPVVGETDLEAEKTGGLPRDAAAPASKPAPKETVTEDVNLMSTVLAAISRATDVKGLHGIKSRLDAVQAEGRLSEQEAKIAGQLWEAKMAEFAGTPAF